MASSLALFTLLFLLFAGSAIGARKDPGEYWREVMKEEAMPQAIQGLLTDDQLSSSLLSNSQILVPDLSRNGDNVAKGFEPKQDKIFWVYDDMDAKLTDEKSFVKDFKGQAF